jgi:AraC-like DNA-binding protein
MARGVVVTGLGVIDGPVCGAGRFAEALHASTIACAEVDLSAGWHLPQSARKAVLTAGLDLSSWVPPSTGRRMSPPSKLGVAAARMAVGAQLTHIAHEVGFVDSAHLSRTWRRTYGFAPSRITDGTKVRVLVS